VIETVKLLYCWRNVERFNKAPVIDDECELSGHDTAKVKCQANQRPGKSQWKHQLYTEQGNLRFDY